MICHCQGCCKFSQVGRLIDQSTDTILGVYHIRSVLDAEAPRGGLTYTPYKPINQKRAILNAHHVAISKGNTGIRMRVVTRVKGGRCCNTMHAYNLLSSMHVHVLGAPQTPAPAAVLPLRLVLTAASGVVTSPTPLGSVQTSHAHQRPL